MAKSINTVIICGRLGQDPEIKYTKNETAVANLSVATDRSFKDKEGNWQSKAEWHKVVAWDRLAEFAKSLTKGQLVTLTGRLETRKWEDSDGNTRYVTEIIANTLIAEVETETPAEEPAGDDSYDDSTPF